MVNCTVHHSREGPNDAVFLSLPHRFPRDWHETPGGPVVEVANGGPRARDAWPSEPENEPLPV
jgi:hypothetical protein